MTQPEQRKSRIPDFASREEEAEFWDTHDITDFLDELKVIDRKDVRVAPNLSENLNIRLTPEILDQLRNQAEQKGIGPSTLARMWILERLQQTEERQTRTSS